jgi:RNA polymerase sigma factor (sigma-70 family)
MPDETSHPIIRLLRINADAEAFRRISDGQLLQRYASERDEAAFEILVHRHGNTVWRVCRNVLREAHAAEDAFQATFLILVRKAGSIGRPELLGNWLYGVAYRVALRARKKYARLREREQQGVEISAAAPIDQGGSDLQPLLVEELQRLPAKYRAALVLCYLEGRSTADAAQQLQWPVGTLKVRLMRGRELLRSRFARRGIALSAVAITAALADDEALAAPAAIVNSTIKAALRFATGQGTGTAVTLTEGVLKTMRWNQVKMIAALLLMLGLLAGGMFTFHSMAADPKNGKSAPTTEAKTKEALETKTDEKPRPDRLAIKGAWTLVYRESAGKRETLTEDSLKKGNGKLTISGDKFTFVEDGTTREGICKINTDKSPKQIDLILAPDPDEVPHAIFRGIYSIEKDKLTICYNDPPRQWHAQANRNRRRGSRTIPNDCRIQADKRSRRTETARRLDHRHCRPGRSGTG